MIETHHLVITRQEVIKTHQEVVITSALGHHYSSRGHHHSSASTGGKSLGQPGDSSSTEVTLDLGQDLEEKSNRSASPREPRSKNQSDSMTRDGRRSPRRISSTPRKERRSRSHSRSEARKMKSVVRKTVCKKSSYKTGLYNYSAPKHASTSRSRNSSSTTRSSYTSRTSSRKTKTSRSFRNLLPDRTYRHERHPRGEED